MTEAPDILEIRGLRAGYGRVPVLHGLDLTIAEGQIVGILGHNGMGKSTLLKTLMGLVPATGGGISFDGMDVTREPSHERARLGIGYVPQGRGIFPTLSVRDNLRMGIAAHDAVDEEAALEAVLREFPQLERLLARQGGALSGGEQQLLALARALVSEPQLLLLDEPTEGIQPSIVDMIEEKLRELAAARGISILLVEQNLEFITDLSDRVLVLQKGLIAGEIGADHTMTQEMVDEFTGFSGGANGAAAPPRPAATTAPPAANGAAPSAPASPPAPSPAPQ
ncbi:MAG: ABC transporter ATP-binding protein, partial [Pseudomonadota bacterium]